jgi:hypothetical protein
MLPIRNKLSLLLFRRNLAAARLPPQAIASAALGSLNWSLWSSPRGSQFHCGYLESLRQQAPTGLEIHLAKHTRLVPGYFGKGLHSSPDWSGPGAVKMGLVYGEEAIPSRSEVLRRSQPWSSRKPTAAVGASGPEHCNVWLHCRTPLSGLRPLSTEPHTYVSESCRGLGSSSMACCK